MIHQPYPPKNTTCTIRPSPQPITLWAAAPGTTNIKGDSFPEPKSFLARPFPQITAMTQGSMDHGNGTHLYHLDLSSDASRYSSIIPTSICNFHPSACTQRAKKVNKTSLLHAAAAAGLSSKELSLNFYPVSVFRWELQWRKERGAGSLCSKWPAAEDLMALSVQSLVGSLTGYRCLLWDGFIPNESELQQGCTQSSAALDSLFVCHHQPHPCRLAHSALSDVPAHS